MRFGISATSGIFPKNLRTRLRPLKVRVWAIVAPCCVSWGGRFRRRLASTARQGAVHSKREKTRFLRVAGGPQERGFRTLALNAGDRAQRSGGRNLRPPETRERL